MTELAGYRHPMGPLRSTDLVGLARGEPGRTSGQGFYRWEDKG